VPSSPTPSWCTMKPRELAGAINRARQIYVWVIWHAPDYGIFIVVSKPVARRILAAAKELNITTLASLDAGDLYIGAPATKLAREEEE
jgi:hypothetical protein